MWVAERAVQIHGGMGYTWEAVDHFFMKRATVLQHRFGDSDEVGEAIAEILSEQSGMNGSPITKRSRRQENGLKR